MDDPIIKKVKRYQIINFTSLSILFLFFFITFIYCAWKMDNTNSTISIFYSSGLPLSLTGLALVYTIFFWFEDRRYRLIEIELDLVRESIDKFYLPFSEILSNYESHGITERKLYDLICYRHLAEPEMNKNFGQYIENGFALTSIRNELQYKISTDVVCLQTRFKYLKEKL